MSTTSDPSAEAARRVRRQILEHSKRANVGHIGSCLSVADLLAVLCGGVIRGLGTDDPDRDRFILSKGHAALALYAALREAEVLGDDDLEAFCGDGSPLGVHPEHIVRGIDFSTGSLGMGLSIGAGAALAARLAGSTRRVYVLMSDAECNEGAVWEAAMFAAHHRLSNLVALVDLNGQQALGYTEAVLDLSPLIDRWRAFGWHAVAIDGHDLEAIADALGRPNFEHDKPQVILANTTFGKGVSFMESQIKWHYLPMSDVDFAKAIADLDAS